jgi:hypothetical protein
MAGLFVLMVFTLAPSLADARPRNAAGASSRARKNDKGAKDFEYSVSDCLESDRRDSMGLIVSDDSVSFNHVFTMNCTAATHPDTVKVVYSKKARNLEVSVGFQSSVLSDCTCPIAIDGKIPSLGKGTYRLSFVYEAKTDDSKEKPARQSLGTQEFTIN